MTVNSGTVQVWADVRCPWCWIGHRRMAEAQKVLLGSNRPVPEVVRRAFLLEPKGPPVSGITVREAALGDWGMSRSDWEVSGDRIESAGRAEGLEIRMDTARIFDSRTVHRLLKLAAVTDDVGVESAWETIFDLHFRRNADLGQAAVLVAAGVEIGLDQAAVEHMLAGAEFVSEVDADLREAQRLGVRSVPTVLAADTMLSGSRSVEDLVTVLAAATEVTA
ncbi:DsbA family oxidoreductase [Aeromicrobium sp. Sec7.5]|uniref:DsbA family oxidoreductase n=1 Tax=Aeromicrobium sp. Sec7.5 TaxID=3121276 RepID=UPI002FE45140